jgi:hypothetical protein
MCLTFPYDKNFPAHRFQFLGVAFIAEDVAEAFGLPPAFSFPTKRDCAEKQLRGLRSAGRSFAEFGADGGADFPITAIMYMPETAVNKDYFFVSWKDYVANSK